MTGNWVWQSVVSMLILSPIWVAIVFFDKNYQIKPNVFLIWYFIGSIAYTAFLEGFSVKSLMPSLGIIFILLVTGLVGGMANTLLFNAVASAPNPGLPVAIGNGASVGSFVLVVLLSRWVPNYFSESKVDIWAFVGILLTVAGVALIATRR